MTNLLALLVLVGSALGWTDERAAAIQAYQAKDYAGFRAHLGKQLEMTGATPSLLYNLACAEALLGHREAALGFLRDWARAGSTGDLAADPDLASLKPDLAPVLALLEQNQKPVGHAEVAFTLPDANLLTEDLAYDPPSRTFYVSSVRARKILAFRLDGQAREFVKPQAGVWSVLALGVDPKARLLYATTAAMPQTPGVTKEELGRSALLVFDLGTGALRDRRDLAPDGKDHVLGDLTVGSDGTVYVSDSVSGVVYLFRGKGLETLTAAGTFNSPQTPTLSPDGRKLFVPDYSRGVAEVDLLSRRVSWLVHPREVAMTGIDGLYLFQGQLVAVQNGTAPMRVGRFQLDPALRRVQGYEPIEMNTKNIGSPTHGVIVGNRFYFIGNSGWERTSDKDDSFKPGAPALILSVKLE